MQARIRPVLLSFVLLQFFALTGAGIGRAASCHVITPAGSGNFSGSDWSNACNGFSGNCAGSAMVHGDSYYVAGGSGGGYSNTSTTGHVVDVVSTGANPSLPIAIKAATVADHCTGTGWNSATMAVDGGAGQAIFTSVSTNAVAFDTPNVTLDGNFSAPDSSNSWGNPAHACAGSQCGIKIDFSVATAYQLAHYMWPLYIGNGANNGTIRSTEFVGCYVACGSQGMNSDVLHLSSTAPGPQNTLVVHNYWHDSPQDYVDSSAETGTKVKYNFFLRNYSHSVAPAVHGAVWSTSGGSNQTFAFNAVQDCQGTSMIDEVNSGTVSTSTGMQVYGNLVWMASGNPSGISGGWDNGVISCTNNQVCVGWKVYNNTLANLNLSVSNSLTGGQMGSGSSISQYNNLFWNSAPSLQGGSCGLTAVCALDYDYFSGTAHTAEPHEKVTSVNPFVSWSSHDFHLSADTIAWIPLGIPYNVDMDGIARSSSRGAYQYGSGSSSVPAAPTSLSATVQ